MKQDWFRSYSGTCQLLLFGVTEWCLFGQCLKVLYQCLIEFSDWPSEIGQQVSDVSILM